jgi:hypothetical protein
MLPCNVIVQQHWAARSSLSRPSCRFHARDRGPRPRRAGEGVQARLRTVVEVL